VLAVGALFLLAFASPARAGADQAAKVIEIRIDGNVRMSDEAILANIKTRVGADYDAAVVRADEKRLLETGRFGTVVASRTYTKEGVIVTFAVAERPLVVKIAFEGNAAYSDDDLAKVLTFGVSDPLDLYRVEAGRQEIQNKYRGSGYHSATVQVDKQALKSGRVVYRIVEGSQAVVTKVAFKGNRHFRTLRLRRETGTAQRIWPLVTGHLDLEQIERDIQTITNLYTAEGFLDVEVGKQLEFSEDKKKVKVTFVIKEGPRFRVNEVIFKGNEVFSDAELARRLKLRRGEFFASLALRRDSQQIRQAYGQLGHVEIEVVAAKQFLDPTAPPPAWAAGLDGGKPALLNVIFKIDEGGQFRVGRIDIRGNTETQGRIIRRELGFFPEQLLNTAAIEQSRRKLMDTGLFKEVNITPVGQSPKTRDVLVEVKEAETGSLIFGVGINTNSGLLGTVAFTQRNFDILRWPTSLGDVFGGRAFKGAGQTFRVVAEPGVDMMRFRIEWFEPYLFDQPYSLGTKAFVFTRDRENYDETRYGGVVSVGRRFRNRWYGEVSSRIEGVEIDNLDSDAPPEVMSDAGTHALVGMKGTLVRDRTDSRWWPTDGDRFRLSYEQIAGGFCFGRAFGDYRIYRTVYMDASDRKHVIAGRFAAGQIFGSAPVFERFYGGGIGSVRGFDYRGISPRSKGTDEPIGGDFMVFAGAEYGFPIVGQQLRGVVFVDTGTVEDNFEITTYRASAGVGLRWLIPAMGPIPMSLDFGFPISKNTDDDTQILSFSLGWTF